MRKLKKRDTGLPKKYVTYSEGAEIYSLGISSLIRLARDSKSLVKIGRSARIDVEKLDCYLNSLKE